VCYLPVLGNGFALDDTAIIRDNIRLHALRTLPEALALPYWYVEGHLYRPLTTLSFGLEWALGRGHPLLFHATNLAWHAIVTALVVCLALRWWPPLAALFAGIWFAVHPVHAEVVANIVGRSELVCAAALLGVALLASAMPGLDAPAERRREWWTAFVLAAAAMASKEIGAVAPIIAWAAAITPTTASGPRDRRRAWRLAGATALGVGVLIAARLIVLGSFAGDEPHYAFTLVHGLRALMLALATIPTAVGLLLVPQPPRLDYSPPESVIFHPPAVAAGLGLALVLAAMLVVLWHARRPNRWSLACCMAVAAYAPVSNLLVRTGIVVADRTLYSASIGVALVVGGAVAAACAARRWLHVALAAVVTAAGTMFTVASLGAWHDSRSAFIAIRDRSPTSFIGHYMVAKVYDVDGDPAAAHLEYARALALTPHNSPLLYMAGANDFRLHDTTAAIDLITQSVALGPTHARARTALATLKLERGDTATAVRLLREGLALDSTQRTWRAMLEGLTATER
jgi:protein O-mannosyl-transferase